MLSRSAWKSPNRGARSKFGAQDAQEIIPSASELEDRGLPSMGESVAIGTSEHEIIVSTGEVVGILQRSQKDYVACLTEEAEAEILQANNDRSCPFYPSLLFYSTFSVCQSKWNSSVCLQNCFRHYACTFSVLEGKLS